MVLNSKEIVLFLPEFFVTIFHRLESQEEERVNEKHFHTEVCVLRMNASTHSQN
jgi:hypothetical protein